MDQKFEKGYLLVANPVLPDPNFSRTVILLCNHNDGGSFGLVLNRVAEFSLDEILAESNSDLPSTQKVFFGGPVGQTQGFFLCRSDQDLPEIEPICPGVYLGMNWESSKMIAGQIENPEENIRFYLGYSGWASGQLAGEMEQKSWLTREANDSFVFSNNENKIWSNVVRSLGKEYEYLLNAPVNPSLN
jgi:putative transcriptional regulator